MKLTHIFVPYMPHFTGLLIAPSMIREDSGGTLALEGGEGGRKESWGVHAKKELSDCAKSLSVELLKGDIDQIAFSAGKRV